MNPFFFNTAEQPLFGLYGPPRLPVDRDEAILLCGPVGHEYMRTHWCLRQLSQDLLQAGFHVLRFDYSCLGDSWGTFEHATVRWEADLQTALDELRDNAGVRKISVVGLRLGATLAFAARETAWHHLVLWDPVLEGRAYLETLRSMQVQQRHLWAYAPVSTAGADFEDLLGYRYSAALVKELGSLNLPALPLPRAERVSLVAPSEDAGYGHLQECLVSHGIPCELYSGMEAGHWESADLYAEPILLPKARRRIVDLLGGIDS